MHVFFILITICRCSTIPIWSIINYFLESFVTPGRYLVSFDFLLPTTFGESLQIPKLLSSCHLTFSFIPVNTLLPLIISEFIITSLSGIYPQKLIQKILFPHSILWSSSYFWPDWNLPLSHYWNSDGLFLSLLCLCIYSVFFFSVNEIST